MCEQPLKRDLTAYSYEEALAVIAGEGMVLTGAEIIYPARALPGVMGRLRVIGQREEGENRLFLILAHEVGIKQTFDTGKEVAEDGLQDL